MSVQRVFFLLPQINFNFSLTFSTPIHEHDLFPSLSLSLSNSTKKAQIRILSEKWCSEIF